MASMAIGSVGVALGYLAYLYKNATMVIWAGTPPISPETAVTGGNTTLATLTFASAPFSSYTTASGLDVQTGSFVSNTVTPSNNGTATFARVSFTLVSSHAGAWTTGQAYTLGDIVTSNGSFWVNVASGTAGATAPTGTHIFGFSDGTCVWTWIQATTVGQVICDLTVGTTSSFDVVVNSTTFSTSINQTATLVQLQSPAV